MGGTIGPPWMWFRSTSTSTPSHPVERALLTTGLTAAGVDSLYEEGKRLETPHLAQVTYQPNPEATFWRT